MRCPDYTCRTLEGCDATCGDGLKYCEVWNNCYDPMWEVCPSCEDATPFYCRPSGSCTASEEECAMFCPAEYPYCYARFAGVRLLLLGAVVAQFGGR